MAAGRGRRGARDVIGWSPSPAAERGRAQAFRGGAVAHAWVLEKAGIVERTRKCGKGSWLWEAGEQEAVSLMPKVRQGQGLQEVPSGPSTTRKFTLGNDLKGVTGVV